MNRALNLLGAIGIGAGLMYIMDPDKGEKRRKVARKQFNSGLKESRKNLNRYGHDVMGRAGKVADRGWDASELVRDAVSEYVQEYGNMIGKRMFGRGGFRKAGKRASEWIEPVRDASGRVIERAGDFSGPYAEVVQEAAEQLGKRVQRYVADMLGARLGPSPWLYAFAGLGFGAALMFILDPSMGGDRRSLVGDKVTGAFNNLRERTEGAFDDTETFGRNGSSREDMHPHGHM